MSDPRRDDEDGDGSEEDSGGLEPSPPAAASGCMGEPVDARLWCLLATLLPLLVLLLGAFLVCEFAVVFVAVLVVVVVGVVVVVVFVALFRGDLCCAALAVRGDVAAWAVAAVVAWRRSKSGR